MVKFSPEIANKLKNSQELPSLPQILLKLIDACSNKDTTPKELADIVFKDPSISAKVLRLINSPFMGLRQKVDNLEKAIILLGNDAITNIAISASVFQVFRKTKGDVQFNLGHFWWHSLFCGTMAKYLAEKTEGVSADEAFLSGLLHDIGKLILWIHFQKEYAEALNEAHRDADILISKENDIGAAHHELGAWFVNHWNLSTMMADAIEYHHEQVERVVDSFALVKVVYVANKLCHTREWEDEAGLSVAHTLFGLNADQVEELIQGAEEEVNEVARSFEIPIEPPVILTENASKKDRKKEQRLLFEVRNFSLLYGTVQNLLKANGIEKILNTVIQAFQILFNLHRFLFFLVDTKSGFLKAQAVPEEAFKNTVDDLFLSFNSEKSLLARSLLENRRYDSFQTTETHTFTIADEQIRRLLGVEGVIYIPLSVNCDPVGVIAAGLNKTQFDSFTKHEKLLNLISGHAAMCLHVEMTKKAQMAIIQNERLEASSGITQKVVHTVNASLLDEVKNHLEESALKFPEDHPARIKLQTTGEKIGKVRLSIKQLKDFSTRSGRNLSIFDPNGLLKNILDIASKSVLPKAKINLQYTPDATVPKMKSDKVGLKRIIINLLKNAVEAMPQGGNLYVKTKLISPEDETWETNNKKTSGMLEIQLKDDGPGIPEEIKDRLFEPFTTTKEDGHSGLGLSIVHNIVRDLFGTIECETSPQMGSVFTVTLPIHMAAC